MSERYKIDRIEELEFGPKAISEMSTLAMDGQRNWRHRGHLAPPDGPRGKMKIRSIAALAVRAWASFLGYPPSESGKIGADSASSVIYWALLSKVAGVDPIMVVGPRAAVGAFHQAFDGEALKIAQFEGEAPYTFVNWSDRDHPAPGYGSSDVADEEGPIVTRHINLVALGRSIVEAAGGPLFKITVLDP